jgi:hypothetical protein
MKKKNLLIEKILYSKLLFSSFVLLSDYSSISKKNLDLKFNFVLKNAALYFIHFFLNKNVSFLKCPLFYLKLYDLKILSDSVIDFKNVFFLKLKNIYTIFTSYNFQLFFPLFFFNIFLKIFLIDNNFFLASIIYFFSLLKFYVI